MKKISFLLAALFLVATVAGCSGGDAPPVSQSPQAAEPSSGAAASSEAAEVVEPPPSSEASAPVGEISVDERVLMEQDGIRVTLTGIDTSGFMGPELKLLVENDSDTAVTLYARDMSVNGIMVEPMLACSVEPGKKANDAITLMSNELEVAGIGAIKDVELKFNVSDNASYETIFQTEAIAFTTSATDYVQEYDDGGTVVLDRDGFRAVVKKLDSDNSFWGAEIYVYVENNSDKDATLYVRDVSVNGFMLEPIFACSVLSGKKAFDTITFMESDLTDNNIADITDMEFSFSVADNNNMFNTIFDSDKVTITF